MAQKMCKIICEVLNNEKKENAPVLRFLIICCAIIVISILLYIKFAYDINRVYYYESVHDGVPRYAKVITSITSKYYVYTSQCHMPTVDPFTPKLRKIYQPKSYEDCAKDEPFISVIYNLNSKRYTMHLNTDIIAKRLKGRNSSVYCCYRQIVRPVKGKNVEKSFTLNKCTNIHQDFIVPTDIEYVITECLTNSRELLQKDAFFFIQYRNFTASNAMNILDGKKPTKPSVLMIGIDSVSRINLRRTMPLTFKYFQTNNWFELQGYNKMGDNTFPNLMAILTSYNVSTANKMCSPMIMGGLNKPQCNLIWNDFHEFGYRTAYAEDTSSIGTFNYLTNGFEKPPTDHYLRPMTLAIEAYMKIKEEENLPFCVGRKHYAEYIFDYAVQFANVYQNEPYFGLFWANSFSHNAYETPSSMDKKIFEYLQTFERNGVLNNAVVFFFSDHGMRFGPLLKLPEGFFEERLPMMFLSLPNWYRNAHPAIVQALYVNRNRLTSPFDIHSTLKQILEMDESEKRLPSVNNTTVGVSLFTKVPENRTCLDAGISEHWCTCVPYQTIDTNDATIKKVSGFVIDEMNKYLAGKGFDSICSEFKLLKIVEAKLKLEIDGEKPQYNQAVYVITYILNPWSKFQVTAAYNQISQKINVNLEHISRLDHYGDTANCIDDKEAKKYCICSSEFK